jgi:serine/threonine protein kinase
MPPSRPAISLQFGRESTTKLKTRRTKTGADVLRSKWCGISSRKISGPQKRYDPLTCRPHTIEPDRLQSFYREVITWKRLSHPNILELIGVMIDEKQYSMVSPWMENGNIIDFLRENHQANPLKLVRLCSILCITSLTPVTVGGRHTWSSVFT